MSTEFGAGSELRHTQGALQLSLRRSAGDLIHSAERLTTIAASTNFGKKKKSLGSELILK